MYDEDQEFRDIVTGLHLFQKGEGLIFAGNLHDRLAAMPRPQRLRLMADLIEFKGSINLNIYRMLHCLESIEAKEVKGGKFDPKQLFSIGLDAISAEVSDCKKCPHLECTRNRTVFGDGSSTARLMFIGDVPGADENRTGQPFVGRAGVLLTDMINKGLGLARADVYITNVLKCQTPANRDPLPDEISNCSPYLQRQIEIISPEFLCLLGRVAAQTLLETSLGVGRLRGKWHRYRGISTIVTYHPSYLLRNPYICEEADKDLQMLKQAMGLKMIDPPKSWYHEMVKYA
jgi:uracil-DNA glycosylase